MKGSRISRLVATTLLVAMMTAPAKAQPAAQSTAAEGAGVREDFKEMLARVDAAQLELQNGKSAAYKALWSRADDTTLSGGFGGTIEKGWNQIAPRLDWVATQFSQGSHAIERLVENQSGDLGYVVQLEHIRFQAPGQAQETTRDYRVTMVFRREAGAWRIVHRQADSQLTKQPAR